MSFPPASRARRGNGSRRRVGFFHGGSRLVDLLSVVLLLIFVGRGAHRCDPGGGHGVCVVYLCWMLLGRLLVGILIRIRVEKCKRQSVPGPPKTRSPTRWVRGLLVGHLLRLLVVLLLRLLLVEVSTRLCLARTQHRSCCRWNPRGDPIHIWRLRRPVGIPVCRQQRELFGERLGKHLRWALYPLRLQLTTYDVAPHSVALRSDFSVVIGTRDWARHSRAWGRCVSSWIPWLVRGPEFSTVRLGGLGQKLADLLGLNGLEAPPRGSSGGLDVSLLAVGLSGSPPVLVDRSHVYVVRGGLGDRF